MRPIYVWIEQLCCEVLVVWGQFARVLHEVLSDIYEVGMASRWHISIRNGHISIQFMPFRVSRYWISARYCSEILENSLRFGASSMRYWLDRASSMRPIIHIGHLNIERTVWLSNLLRGISGLFELFRASISWHFRASWATCCEVMSHFRAISLMWDARFLWQTHSQTSRFERGRELVSEL